jgi:4-hydroxy-3-polyprenylbenzoate decarboxylase
VIFVAEDVDLCDSLDVLWAMQTRYSGDLDTIFVPGVAGHVLDPPQTPRSAPSVTAKGTTRTIFDCTVPVHPNRHIARAQFKAVDASLSAPSRFGKAAE